jgi:hypothetical protein
LNPLILHLVSSHVFCHFIINLNNATCLSLCMNIDIFNKMYWHGFLVLNDKKKKSMFIHPFICIRFYNLFIKSIKGSTHITRPTGMTSKPFKKLTLIFSQIISCYLLLVFMVKWTQHRQLPWILRGVTYLKKKKVLEMSRFNIHQTIRSITLF